MNINQYIGTIICCGFALIFLLISAIFLLWKAKAAILISGFNSLSKEERSAFDQNQMSLDMRNMFFWWTCIMLVGAIASYYLSQFIALFICILWLILFIREVDWNGEKAFENYRLLPK